MKNSTESIKRCCLVVGFLLVAIQGCDSSRSENLLRDSGDSNEANPTESVSTMQAVMTDAEMAEEDARINAMYAKLDAQIAHPANIAIWIPPVDLNATIVRVAPTATIGLTGCAADFCRYTVVLQSKQALQEFPKNLMDLPGPVIFSYPSDNPLSVVAYVFRANLDLRSL